MSLLKYLINAYLFFFFWKTLFLIMQLGTDKTIVNNDT